MHLLSQNPDKMHFEAGRLLTGLKYAGLQTCRPAVPLAGEDKRAQLKGFVLLETQPAFSGGCSEGDCSNIASPLLLVGIATHMYNLC